MKYMIYGTGRVAKDFIYFFSDLEILAFIDDKSDVCISTSLEIVTLEKAVGRRNEYDQIIVCTFDKEAAVECLEGVDLKTGTDYIFADDFFGMIDPEGNVCINPDGKKIIIWGTGKNSTTISEYYTFFEPVFYVDTYKAGGFFYDKKVLSPEEIEKWEDFFVLVAVEKDKEIIDYLESKLLKENKDYINYINIITRPSEMLRATIYDKHQYFLNCETPLNHMEYLGEGKIYCCCSTFMRMIGDSGKESILSIWESPIHKIICLSVQNHTYTFCKKDMCPLLFGKETDRCMVNRNDYKKMQPSPEVCAIGFDYTCNLRCETCREHVRVASGDEQKKMMRLAQIVEEQVLPGSKFFVLAGDGEVFVSEAYKYIYNSEKMDNVPYIRILSNGTLFNRDNWERFKKGKKGKIMLTASVDAASKETYEQIRINGNFDKLKENMEFAGQLRRKGELAYFRMNFVVQKRNYKEIPDFVKWGIQIGADEVFFTKILNWGIYTEDEFKEISMFEEDGVTPKKELQEILDSDVMQERIVDLGTIKYQHDTMDDINIHNYYMWELERKVPRLFSKADYTL